MSSRDHLLRAVEARRSALVFEEFDHHLGLGVLRRAGADLSLLVTGIATELEKGQPIIRLSKGEGSETYSGLSSGRSLLQALGLSACC